MKIEWNRVTWYSKILALALFVALPFAGFWFGIRYGAARQYMADVFANQKNASSVSVSQGADAYYKNVSVWQTDGRTDAGFSIAYPIDFSADDNYSPAVSANWSVNSGGIQGIKYLTMTIPRAFEPQTNFADATLTVGKSSIQQLQAGSLGCLGEHALMGEPSDYPSIATSTVTINNATFTILRSSDAGAGNYYETTSYRALHAGQCWAVEYTIHSSQIGNYPSEYQLKPLDEAKLRDVLDRIAGTFRFL
jgi:hypothetical protein